MKKVLTLVAVIVVIALAVIFWPHNKPADTAASQHMPDMSPATTGTAHSPATQAPTATNSVTIQNFAFSPATITVKKGTSVTWTNQDATAHTVTENDGRDGPGSGSLGKGQSYSFTYDTAGTFTYHCSIHPDMLGTVIVTE